MLRRCDSIVFSLRKSCGGDLLVRHPVHDQVADLALALGQRLDARVVGRRRSARLGAGAELAQLAPRLVAHPHASRSASSSRSASRSTSIARAAVAGRGQRLPEQAARAGDLEPGADRRARRDRTRSAARGRARRRRRCASCTAARVRAASAVGRRRSTCGGGVLRAARDRARPPRAFPSASSARARFSQLKQRSAGTQFCSSSPPTSCISSKRLLELAELEAGQRQRPAGPAAAAGIVPPAHPPAHAHALLARVDRRVEVAGEVARAGELAQRPEQVVRVCRQPRDLDARSR